MKTSCRRRLQHGNVNHRPTQLVPLAEKPFFPSWLPHAHISAAQAKQRWHGPHRRRQANNSASASATFPGQTLYPTLAPSQPQTSSTSIYHSGRARCRYSRPSASTRTQHAINDYGTIKYHPAPPHNPGYRITFFPINHPNNLVHHLLPGGPRFPDVAPHDPSPLFGSVCPLLYRASGR